jgi:hypothetical protein
MKENEETILIQRTEAVLPDFLYVAARESGRALAGFGASPYNALAELLRRENLDDKAAKKAGGEAKF